MVVWLVFGRGKGAAGLEVGGVVNMSDEDLEVDSAAFKEGLELHDTGAEGGGVDATDDAEEVDVFDLGEEVIELGRGNLGIGSFPAAVFAPAKQGKPFVGIKRSK